MTTLISYNCNTFKILTRFEIKHSSIEDEQNEIYNLKMFFIECDKRVTTFA